MPGRSELHGWENSHHAVEGTRVDRRGHSPAGTPPTTLRLVRVAAVLPIVVGCSRIGWADTDVRVLFAMIVVFWPLVVSQELVARVALSCDCRAITLSPRGWTFAGVTPR